ncbi:MAG: hypothetical protein Q4D19_07105 [Lautropia sp.]|nr:hypothetical protein [Lautropia sp.]
MQTIQQHHEKRGDFRPGALPGAMTQAPTPAAGLSFMIASVGG